MLSAYHVYLKGHGLILRCGSNIGPFNKVLIGVFFSLPDVFKVSEIIGGKQVCSVCPKTKRETVREVHHRSNLGLMRQLMKTALVSLLF